jgi:hypothetical protein
MFMLPGSVGEYRLAKWALTGALVAVLAGITLIGLRTRRIDFGALDLRLGALAALAIGAAAVAPLASTAYPIAHAGGALRLGLGLAFGCLTALSFAGADRAARRSGLLILIGVGAACALVVVLQAATIYPFSNLIFQNPELRASGTFGNPNWAAAFLLALVPICLGIRRVFSCQF